MICSKFGIWRFEQWGRRFFIVGSCINAEQCIVNGSDKSTALATKRHKFIFGRQTELFGELLPISTTRQRLLLSCCCYLDSVKKGLNRTPNSYRIINRCLLLIPHPKVGEGNVFTGVCLSAGPIQSSVLGPTWGVVPQSCHWFCPGGTQT